MARTLPWLKDQGASQARARTTRAPPTKRSRPLDSDSDASEHARSIQRAHAKQRRELAQRAGRTPTTSPPPAPPSVELVWTSSPKFTKAESSAHRYMRPGLPHDDIYIMVEDEFLSTAQLFTSHLHHAEYVRLKNAAKARSTTTSATISRPTDSITAMRAETKKKKEAEIRIGKNKAALDKMKADARAKIAITSDEDSEEHEEAPWAGTSLQGLMAPTAKKNLTSLSGLQGIQSSTRAAKGYSKPDESQNQSNRAEKNIFRSFAKPPRQSHESANISREQASRRLSNISSSSASSDDDLDAPPRSSKPHAKCNPPQTHTNPLTLAAENLFHSNQPPKPNCSTARKQQNTLLDSSPPSQNDEVAAARQRLQQRRERAAAAAAAANKGDKGIDGNVNINEIPVFLV
ncbi:MAG: hypothetical protein Q9209_004184 [Squamulea sp. 1 TL-2023]